MVEEENKTKQIYGWTALHFASFHGNLEEVKALVSGGVDINAQEQDGNTALHNAIRHDAVDGGGFELVMYLIENGADINAKTFKGLSVLGYATVLDRLDIIKELIARGAQIGALTFREYPYLVIDKVHEQMKGEDKWTSALNFWVQEKANNEEFKDNKVLFEVSILRFIDKTATEIPDNIRIGLKNLIKADVLRCPVCEQTVELHGIKNVYMCEDCWLSFIDSWRMENAEAIKKKYLQETIRKVAKDIDNNCVVTFRQEGDIYLTIYVLNVMDENIPLVEKGINERIMQEMANTFRLIIRNAEDSVKYYGVKLKDAEFEEREGARC